MRIRVAIPARNAGWCIEECLAGLFAAGFAPDDITLADDGSTDDTAAMARAAGVRVVSCPEKRGAAAARNRAAAEGEADVLFFVDSDVVVRPDVRERLVAMFENHPEIDAVFGAYDDAPLCRGSVSQYRNLLHHYVHCRGPVRPKSFWTGCGAVRRPVFERLGGFDPAQRMMEDVEFGMRLSREGGVIALYSRLQGKHLKTWSLPGMVRCDLFDRAIPWSRLMLFGDGLSADLNLDYRHRLSAGLTGLFGLGLLGAPLEPSTLWLSVLALIVFIRLNATFLRFLAVRAGRRIALKAVPLHLLHYACAIIGLAWVLVFEWLPHRVSGSLARLSAIRPFERVKDL